MTFHLVLCFLISIQNIGFESNSISIHHGGFFGPINDTAYGHNADHRFEGTELFERLGISSTSADMNDDGVGDLVLDAGNGQVTVFSGADWVSEFW